MAKLRGVGTRLSGSVGEWTFADTIYGTIARQKAPAHNNSRSFAQMRQRVQIRNIQNLWHCFGGELRPYFEDRRPTLSNYSAFVSANLRIVPVYLTKDEAADYGCVVAGYQITRGSLPEIHYTTGSGDLPVTDIFLGGLTLGPTTTIKQFADAVCNNNGDDFQHLDAIRCFRCTQSDSDTNGMPHVRLLAVEVILDRSDDETMLYDVCSDLCFSTVDGYLGAQSSVDGGIAWVHTRLENDKLRVSTQRFRETNSILYRYQSEEHLEEAVKSYGGDEKK